MKNNSLIFYQFYCQGSRVTGAASEANILGESFFCLIRTFWKTCTLETVILS